MYGTEWLIPIDVLKLELNLLLMAHRNACQLRACPMVNMANELV